MSKPASDRVRVKRLHERASYDAPTVHAIIDEMPLCTVAYVNNAQPYATSTLLWREGDHIYWHGSSASRMLKSCRNAEVCVNVTILDGMVLAKSAFHHSCNYRSVMIFGTAFIVAEAEEKEHHLKLFTEKLFPGRWQNLRPLKDQELKATMILGLSLAESSAKVRTGMPSDDQEDKDWPIWTGVIPIKMQAGAAIAAEPQNENYSMEQKSLCFPFFDYQSS